ncbi:MAG TPA: PAS domain S-box protein, partial [Acidobacteriota bacterium]|nr:PAS domain S-box protein [Acidobacteriota bacterium]
MQSHSENVRYGSKEKEVLTFVSQHIAGALERKKAQDALRLREARLRFLVEQMPAIFWSTDMNLRITTSRGAGLSRIKMKPDQTVGLNLADVLRGEDVEALVLDAHVKALEGESVAYEYEFRNRDFRVHVEPWRDQNGSIIGTLGLAFDVTEPKKAEEELERSLSLLRATLESTADGILVVDQEGKWISFNKKFVEMWRIPEAIVNSRDEALMLAYVLDQVKDPQEFVAKLKQLYTSYEEESFDVVEFRDGRLFERYSQPQVIAGKSVGRVWSFRNVTERKRAEGLRSALYRIAAQTSIAEDMQEFYAAIHKIVGELMYAKNFYIALYDKTQHILSFPYFVDELDTPPPPKSPAKGLTEYVLAHGEPLLASPEKFTELVDSGDVESVGAPSVDWLGAPLKSADRTFGVLVVQSYTEEVRFGEREKEVLTFVSQHIASALERKRAQESLSESAEQLEKSLSIVSATLESTADGILVVDNSGRISIYNQRFLDMWRIPEDVMASRDDTRAIQFVLDQLKDPDGFLAKVQELYTNPVSESYDVLEFKDGRIFERYSVPQRIGNKTVGRVWSFSDVTQHRQAEQALRESAERYALAALGANDGLWDWNLKTNEVYYSARWRAMLGCAEEEIGTSPDEWLNRVHPDDIARVQSEIEAHLQGLTPHFENEHRMLHKDGTHRWMLTRGIAVPDSNGRASRMAGSQTDVTDRKNAEERLMHEAIHDVLTGLANRA